MLKKEKYIISAVAIAIIIAFMFVFTQDRNYYAVENVISDSSAQGKVVFYFVKVKQLDEDFLLNTAHNLRDTDSNSYIKDNSQLRVMVAHFYRDTDIEPMPDSLMNKLHAQKPSSKGREYRLDYVRNGYIYTDISQNLPDLKYPKDSLFASQLFIPKKGYSIKEIFNADLRRSKSYLYGKDKNKKSIDSTKKIEIDSNMIMETEDDRPKK